MIHRRQIVCWRRAAMIHCRRAVNLKRAAENVEVVSACLSPQQADCTCNSWRGELTHAGVSLYAPAIEDSGD